MNCESIILDAHRLLSEIRKAELERSGKLIDKKKFRWIMTQEV